MTSTLPFLVVIGPSAAGKSTVVRALVERGVVRVHPTWTTRPRRPDETDGSPEHVFVSDAEFDELERRGFFLDAVALFGLPYRYGLPSIERSADERIDAVMLRAPLVGRFVQTFGHAVVVQIEDTPARIARRLGARGTSGDDLAARLSDNERERAAGRALADLTFVNDGSPCDLADEIAAALATSLGAAA
jgi:guanylate kinase